MKKLIALILVCALAFSVIGCSSAEETQTKTEEKTEDKAQDTTATDNAAADNTEAEKFVFKHGFDLDYPPYSYIQDDGTKGGFDVEMCQAVCDYLGWGYEAVPFNWDAKDAELNAKNCDCIWSGFTMDGREDDYTWSKVYSNNTQMIMVPADSEIKTLADLAGKTVGVQTATSAYELLNDEEGQKALCDTFASLEVFDTYTIAFTNLQAGAIDAIAIDATAGNFLMSGSEGYKYLDEALGIEQYAIGFRKGDTELCEKVNQALQALVNDGTYDKIGQKYPDIYDYLCLTPEN